MLSSGFTSHMAAASSTACLPDVSFHLGAAAASLSHTLNLLRSTVFRLSPRSGSHVTSLLVRSQTMLHSSFIRSTHGAAHARSTHAFALPTRRAGLASNLPALCLLSRLTSVSVSRTCGEDTRGVLRVHSFLLSPAQMAITLIKPSAIHSGILGAMGG